jgi:hypothetical protein
MAGPQEVLAAGPAAATTKAEDVDGGPLGGAEAEDLGTPITNAKKHRRRTPGTCRSWRSGKASHSYPPLGQGGE